MRCETNTRNDVKSFFRESQEAFTIYVVEQRFVAERGYEYFNSFIGKENLIVDDSSLKKRINKLLAYAQNHVPNVAELIKVCFSGGSLFSPSGIIDVINALSKLFSIEKHQAVGPENINPLIIQEGKISKKYLSQLVSLHQESILQPTIIILLLDNNFDRAKELVSKCPCGINVKFIKNSGECTIYKIVNSGAENTNELIDLFSKQCFSTCSSTKRDILFSEPTDNNMLFTYAPHILRFRSLLVEEDDSPKTLSEINQTINAVIAHKVTTEKDLKIKESLLCMLKLFKVYCMNKCTPDMYDAMKLSQSIGNDILQAHVLRYSNFLPNISIQTKNEMLVEASGIFEKNNVEDHAIYCTNNYLINQFYTDKIDIKAFNELQEKAEYNVPGLVGMSYIFNNTGVAFLYSHRYDDAIESFEKGISYAKYRPMQRIGLMTNLYIAKCCNFNEISNAELYRLVTYIFDLYGCDNSPFLTANYVMNLVAIASKYCYSFAEELIRIFPICRLIQTALSCEQFGTGSLSLQVTLLQTKHANLFPCKFYFPKIRTPISGIRMRFLCNHMLHPTIFNAWL